jgi:Protein of unknown function (DUF1488)
METLTSGMEHWQCRCNEARFKVTISIVWVLKFAMLNEGKIVPCAISTAAVDDLEGRRDVKAEQREDQFIRLRDVIEDRVSHKFFEEQAEADRPVVLRSTDFRKWRRHFPDRE